MALVSLKAQEIQATAVEIAAENSLPVVTPELITEAPKIEVAEVATVETPQALEVVQTAAQVETTQTAVEPQIETVQTVVEPQIELAPTVNAELPEVADTEAPIAIEQSVVQ